MRLLARAHAHRWRLVGALVALAVVVAGKEYYRTASAEDLRWILAPTAWLVSLVTPGTFTWEAGVGYADLDLRFIIAAPCAGLNFALAAFLALAIGGLRGMTSARTTATRLALAAAAAVAATLVVNTARIALAIATKTGAIPLEGDRDELHRLEGIVVYLGGLCALYALARAVDRRRGHAVA